MVCQLPVLSPRENNAPLRREQLPLPGPKRALSPSQKLIDHRQLSSLTLVTVDLIAAEFPGSASRKKS
jgi:hypothetical protein